MRSLLALLVLLAALGASFLFTPHHEGKNAFETLFFHVVPAPLVFDNHAEVTPDNVILEIPLPAALASIDYRGEAAPQPNTAPKTALFNLQIFQLAAVLLVLVIFSGVPAYLRTGRGEWLVRVASGWAMWIRDEMVYPTMGKELGAKFLPYFLCVFFFIVFMNLMGLTPFSATPTASVFVTAALALTTFVAMLGCGMVAQGPAKFWTNLVPHMDLKGPMLAIMWALMFVVEFVGLLVKPFALMIRLFANMTGGHMVVLSFMALIFFFAAQMGTVVGWAASPAAVGLAVFIMIIETFVALLQAYVFTQLSIIFVNASVHPDH